jgi:hypothetical protein
MSFPKTLPRLNHTMKKYKVLQKLNKFNKGIQFMTLHACDKYGSLVY